jgi:hypothetical protein
VLVGKCCLVGIVVGGAWVVEWGWVECSVEEGVEVWVWLVGGSSVRMV